MPLQLSMDIALKLGDQIYSSVFAKNRWVSEIVCFAILAILLHVAINVFSERATSEAAAPKQNSTNRTSGDQSPIISEPQGPVTLNQEMKK